MAFGIPNTGSPGTSFLTGLKTGSSIYDMLAKRQLLAQELAQKQKQHEEMMALRRQTAASAHALDPLRMELLRQKIQAEKNKADPEFLFKQLQALEGGSENAGGAEPLMTEPTEQQSFIPGFQETEEPFATPELQAENAVSPREASLSAQKMQKGIGKIPGNINLKELVRRAIIKKATGIDIGGEKVLHGPARDREDLEELKRRHGEDSDIYQEAKAAYDAQKDAKKDLRDLRARTKAGLKPGEKEFFDQQTGQPLGKEIPLTAAERASEEGASLFNELYPYVYKGAAPFSGEGSIRHLEEAAANYKTNPAARKAFDDFLLSDKMMAATLVNESATLKAGKTNRTYQLLKDSLDANDIPKRIKALIKQYQIPASAQMKASMRYQELLSKARKNAKKNIPATQKLFYNPEQQQVYEQQKQERTLSAGSQLGNEKRVIDGKTYEKINGEWYESE